MSAEQISHRKPENPQVPQGVPITPGAVSMTVTDPNTGQEIPLRTGHPPRKSNKLPRAEYNRRLREQKKRDAIREAEKNGTPLPDHLMDSQSTAPPSLTSPVPAPSGPDPQTADRLSRLENHVLGISASLETLVKAIDRVSKDPEPGDDEELTKNDVVDAEVYCEDEYDAAVSRAAEDDIVDAEFVVIEPDQSDVPASKPETQVEQEPPAQNSPSPVVPPTRAEKARSDTDITMQRTLDAIRKHGATKKFRRLWASWVGCPPLSMNNWNPEFRDRFEATVEQAFLHEDFINNVRKFSEQLVRPANLGPEKIAKVVLLVGGCAVLYSLMNEGT